MGRGPMEPEASYLHGITGYGVSSCWEKLIGSGCFGVCWHPGRASGATRTVELVSVENRPSRNRREKNAVISTGGGDLVHS
uniref:Uncharacterized protein n=1 Tax=Candidatus Kentrum sp. UNK TaxID=2126344 RepID=A0A451ALJ7_9GAMM|nr:MAG: hypothetical protein BECKUNK1418G_GA0071005_11153 [Candidatus Kentron sp. UNK]